MYQPLAPQHLHKHFATSQQEASVVLEIGITDADRENFRFIYQQRGLFGDLARKYSEDELIFPHFAHIQDVMRIDSLTVKVVIDTERGSAHSLLVNSSPALDAWYWYFSYFSLFQMLLVIHNHHLYRDDPLPGLHSNFAVLGPSRDFAEDEMEYGSKQWGDRQLDRGILPKMRWNMVANSGAIVSWIR